MAAEATITLKLDPRSFDVLREALEAQQKEAAVAARDQHSAPGTKTAARKRHVEITDLLARLR